MTKKLYYEDLYQQEFDAVVVSQREEGDKVFTALDQTLFYPGGGGQPCDLGTLGGRNVLEVLEEDEEIIHVLDGPLDGAEVHGAIDWGRRFELMQQHLGQHLLAAALHSRFSLRTARMRIEGEDVSMDLDAHVEEPLILEAEAEANEAVWRDIPVEILYPPFEEVQLHARKLPPKSGEPIRIIKVGDFDYVPCCGLHVRSTGQVGVIKVTVLENHKGGTRVHLRCGRPALRWLASLCHEARLVQLELASGVEGMAQRVSALKVQVKDLTARNRELLNQAAAVQAADLLRSAKRVKDLTIVDYLLPQGDHEEAKRLFHALTRERDVVALLGGTEGERPFLFFGRNKEDGGADVRDAFRAAASVLGCRGGGSPDCAQGFGGEPARLTEALAAGLEEIKKHC